MYFFPCTLVLNYNSGIHAREKRLTTYLKKIYCTNPLQNKTFSALKLFQEIMKF